MKKVEKENEERMRDGLIGLKEMRKEEMLGKNEMKIKKGVEWRIEEKKMLYIMGQIQRE